MALTAAELVKADQEHLIHPLHHPVDTAEPMIYVRGRGATITDIGGHEYLDGLSGLWNVNVGHGRAELAEAAAEQMKELAYYSGYVGLVQRPRHQPGQPAASSSPTPTCRRCSSPAAAPSRTSRPSRRRASTGRRRASPTRSRSSRASTAITASRCRR